MTSELTKFRRLAEYGYCLLPDEAMRIVEIAEAMAQEIDDLTFQVNSLRTFWDTSKEYIERT